MRARASAATRSRDLLNPRQISADASSMDPAEPPVHRLVRFAVPAALAGLVLAYLVVAVTLPQQDPVMGFFRTYVHSGLMLAAAIGGVVVARRSAPRERAAWWALAGGLVAYAGGEIVWRFVYAEQAAPPYPSFADVLWLTTYPLFYVGVMLLIRARVAAFQSGAWLDGLIACSAVAAVAVTFYFVPVLERTEGDAAAIAVTMAYPIGDGLLWVLLLAALALSGRMTPSFALLAACPNASL